MKKLLFILFLFIAGTALSQPWSPSGTCDFTDGTQWNNGGAKGCACTWYSVSGVDTTLNCAYGDCGQNALYECVYDCNGHNGYVTDMVPRQCDGTANPGCWYNGSGNAGELYCAGIALPIELLDFWGDNENGTNTLQWATASEMNNERFEVYYSIDGMYFDKVVEMEGAGNSTSTLHYRFIHLNPKPGIGYYFLRQVDYNGEYKDSYVIAINNALDRDNGPFSAVYPNPTEGNISFMYTGKDLGTPIRAKIMDMSGRIYVDETITDFGNGTVKVELRLSPGVYWVELSQGSAVSHQRLVVK